ncbi:putative quinol monooxygenase [Rivibacter subsaxonicus]|uniref:Quinol monooxygenase YgiN n=1 Tax=Rivibacter subsaxonicus TaxID=457575 RepID=A0A4Q7W0U7_9BURK|nr:antibiotic biosynthesis monooxygenase [Rivibacter subsaxonicus]RZU02633.1 quinol monooxygenase YgiN [Rivibacter subsaxonicus]
MILVTGSLVAREGGFEQALALSLEHVRRSRLEPGCLAHAVHIDAEDASRLVFVEQWADPPALKAHFALPASRAFARAIAALAVGEPQLSVFDATSIDARI